MTTANGTTDKPDAIAQSGGRAPLLWLLIPAAAGIAAARVCPLAHPVISCLFAVCCAIAALLSVRKGEYRHFRFALQMFVICCSAFALFWSYGSVRMLDRLEWRAALPPREVVMEMRVENAYPTDKWKRERGIARIVSAPYIQDYLVGQKVIYTVQSDIPVREGATICVKGIIQRQPLDSSRLDARNGSFQRWLANSEVYFELKRAHLIEETAPPSRYTSIMLSARKWMREKLLEGSDELPYIRAMVPAMLLGESNLLSPDDKAMFKQTGMMHLFAVSGLHVGLVALTLEALLAAFRIGRTPRIIAALVGLLGYVLVIGAPASAVRAFLMIAFHRVGTISGRPAHGLPALTASAVAVLIWNPSQLFDAGAQLSYGIVLGIIIYGIPLGRLMSSNLPLYEDLPPVSLRAYHKAMLWAREWLCAAFGTTLGAFIIGTPLSVQYFGNFAPGSLLLNLLLIPLALLSAVASVLTILIAGASLIPGFAWLLSTGVFFNYADWLCAWEMQGIIDAVSKVPLLFWKMSFPASWCGYATTIAMIALMFMLRAGKVRRSVFWMLSPVLTLAAVVAICWQ